MSHRKTTLAWRLFAPSLIVLPAVACISSSSSPAGGDGGASSGSGSGSASSGSPTDSGSANCPGPPTGAVLVDDMETGMGSIIVSGGRAGAWYTYNDQTPAAPLQMPIPMTPFTHAALNPARCGSKFAAETSGSGFTNWGAGVGFNFNDPGNGEGGSAKSTYDASAFSGIGFFAKRKDMVVSDAVTVSVTDKNTDPDGGVCVKTGTTAATNGCNDAFAISFGTPPLDTLTPDWKWYAFKWTDLKQQGFGMPIPTGLDAKHIYALHFQVPKSAVFDFFIDDVYLLP